MHRTIAARVTQALLYAVFFAGGALWLALPFYLEPLLKIFDDGFFALPGYHAFILAFLMLAGAAGLYIVFELIRLLRTLRGDPFIVKNVKALKRMGAGAFVITALFVVKCLVYFTPMTLVGALIILLLGLFALVLSNLFEKAVEYKLDNELTI